MKTHPRCECRPCLNTASFRPRVRFRIELPGPALAVRTRDLAIHVCRACSRKLTRIEDLMTPSGLRAMAAEMGGHIVGQHIEWAPSSGPRPSVVS